MPRALDSFLMLFSMSHSRLQFYLVKTMDSTVSHRYAGGSYKPAVVGSTPTLCTIDYTLAIYSFL